MLRAADVARFGARPPAAGDPERLPAVVQRGAEVDVARRAVLADLACGLVQVVGPVGVVRAAAARAGENHQPSGPDGFAEEDLEELGWRDVGHFQGSLGMHQRQAQAGADDRPPTQGATGPAAEGTCTVPESMAL